MKNSHNLIGLSFIVLSLPTAADHHFRQLDSHQHGVVEWHIAQSNDELLIEISAPGSDVVGFEHPPKNIIQAKQIKNALVLLSDPEELLAFNKGADCHLVSQNVSQSLGELTHDAHHQNEIDSHAEHESHDHHDEHKGHDHHDEHENYDHHDEHKSHDHHEKKESHGEFSVQYSFHCDSPNKLAYLETSWFSQFKNTKEIKVEAITDKGIKALTLNVSKQQFTF